jgi:hypothetical protein
MISPQKQAGPLLVFLSLFPYNKSENQKEEYGQGEY